MELLSETKPRAMFQRQSIIQFDGFGDAGLVDVKFTAKHGLCTMTFGMRHGMIEYETHLPLCMLAVIAKMAMTPTPFTLVLPQYGLRIVYDDKRYLDIEVFCDRIAHPMALKFWNYVRGYQEIRRLDPAYFVEAEKLLQITAADIAREARRELQ